MTVPVYFYLIYFYSFTLTICKVIYFIVRITVMLFICLLESFWS